MCCSVNKVLVLWAVGVISIVFLSSAHLLISVPTQCLREASMLCNLPFFSPTIWLPVFLPGNWPLPVGRGMYSPGTLKFQVVDCVLTVVLRSCCDLLLGPPDAWHWCCVTPLSPRSSSIARSALALLFPHRWEYTLDDSNSLSFSGTSRQPGGQTCKPMFVCF